MVMNFWEKFAEGIPEEVMGNKEFREAFLETEAVLC
jgi:hypothetical protein